METYFDSFQNDHYSANAFFSTVDEDMKDQLDVLESIKEEDSKWKEELKKPQHLVGKEDFQQIMPDWQHHVKLLQSSEAEYLGLGLDSSLDILNTYTEKDFYEDKESPILSKALKCPNKKNNIANIEQNSKSLGDLSKEMFSQSFNTSKISANSSHKVIGLIKSEPNLIRKVTLLNGEKEILGKNIIGLHCLNEIKENPDENCQVTSTVINGKKYKIIIRPKSLKVNKFSEEKIRKTLIKKLFKCNLVTKTEPKEDEIISEMRNGNYDVPILGSDVLPSWDLVNLDGDWRNQMEDDLDVGNEQIEDETVKKVPPLKIKIPKLKKHKKKKSISKSDEDVDVETIIDKPVDGSNLKNLLENFEDEMAKFQKKESNNLNTNVKKTEEKSENVKNSVANEVIEKIETLKRKKDHRITLIQAMPSKKLTRGCTRMQDAVATMNRNKLLKIVSGGDTVQLDHDYCSSFIVNSAPTKHMRKLECLEEKNPKKDSGMESGDVSDASEGPYTPENSQTTQPLINFINKKVENCSVDNNHGNVTKGTVDFFPICKSAILKSNVSNTDLVKTKTASQGNKALTNSTTQSIDNSDSGVSVPSANINISEKQTENKCKNYEMNQNQVNNNSLLIQSERPKRKLKLEEYLSRRNIKEKEKISNFCSDSIIGSSSNNEISKNNVVISEPDKVRETKEIESIIENKKNENYGKDKTRERENTKLREKKEKNYWKERSRSSSSSSSERRGKRRKSRSRSNSCWRSDSNGSSGKRCEGRGKYKHRHSESRDRKKRENWFSSLSRSPSRESSTSSDYYESKRHKKSPSRYRQRSRSRSVSRLRSGSQNRTYFTRRPPGNYYCNRNLNNRSKSPFYYYSMREKQRQIEERRVIYVGRIEEGMTNAKLRERFSIFGPIVDISLHFREYGDNYGFVTYAYKADAYDAVEHGNDNPSLPHYDLCFGGRRGFCKEKYADLDGMPTSYSGFNNTSIVRNSNESFDLLLKEAQAKLKKRKKQ